MSFNECIELPVVILDVKRQKGVGEFHTYVRPTMERRITPFCTEMTGITDEMCNGLDEDGKRPPTIDVALALLHDYLYELGIFNREFAFVSFGSFEGHHLYRESLIKKFPLPNYFKRWIDVSCVFPKSHADKGKRGARLGETTFKGEAA